MSVPADVYDDLAAEGEALDQVVAGLSAVQWDAPSAAPGWTVRHQVAHLSSMARVAGTAASDPELFAKALAGAGSFDQAVQGLLTPYLAMSPADLLARWRDERTTAFSALAAHPVDQPVPWVVRTIPVGVLASVGIMELFAHGHDIADALGLRVETTDRIGHLAWLATRNRDFGYEARGLTPPGVPFRFELTAPSGGRWEFGPADAENRITGQAADFCLLATRRRHRADLDLRATGAEADRWMDIAQAYRGGPGEGRTPGQFGPPPAA